MPPSSSGSSRRPQDVVARGYDAGADAFEAWQKQITGSTRLERLEELVALLPEHPDVLELGSGAGVRSTRVLAERSSLIGVDISAEQVRRSRKRVPGATFVHADFTRIELQPESFDAVVAFYVLNHVPRDELGPLLERVAVWLRPGGWFLGTFGASDLSGWYGEWLNGVETYFSGYEPEITLGLVHDAGLELVRHDLETMDEPEGPATFLWTLATRRKVTSSARRTLSR